MSTRMNTLSTVDKRVAAIKLACGDINIDAAIAASSLNTEFAQRRARVLEQRVDHLKYQNDLGEWECQQ